MLSLSCLAAIVVFFSSLTSPAKAAVVRAVDDIVATVTVTDMHTSTVVFTTSSFAYSVSTSTLLATVTQTTYVSATSPPSRKLKGRVAPHSILNAPEELPTASPASLANVKRAAGSTITTTVNAGLTITSFVNIGATRFDETVTSTITTTLKLAAPTFSHVYAAGAGCQNTPIVDTLQLDPSITDRNSAISMCQDSCAQNGKCRSLFVQQLFPSYGDTIPVYKCFMNGQSFDKSSNLVCGLAENVWGVGDAYDAVGRGVSS